MSVVSSIGDGFVEHLKLELIVARLEDTRLSCASIGRFTSAIARVIEATTVFACSGAARCYLVASCRSSLFCV
jgi:hypothetical protein